MAIEQEIATESIQPVWPPLPETGFPSAWRSYDLPSDTLMIYFGGQSVPAFSDFVEGDKSETIYLRLDVHSNEVVGLQLEYFLSLIVPSRPELYALLQGTALLGLTRQDLRSIADLLGINQQGSEGLESFNAVLTRLLSDIKGGRPPLPIVVEPDQRILDKVHQAVKY